MELAQLGNDDFRLLLELETKSPEYNPWDYESWDGYGVSEAHEGEEAEKTEEMPKEVKTEDEVAEENKEEKREEKTDEESGELPPEEPTEEKKEKKKKRRRRRRRSSSPSITSSQYRRTCCILSWNGFIMYQDIVSLKVCILPILSMSVPPMFLFERNHFKFWLYNEPCCRMCRRVQRYDEKKAHEKVKP